MRLNLSYNKLVKIGPLASFPVSLKHLDLGHNQIDSWPTEITASMDNICYAEAILIGMYQAFKKKKY
jgi:Leucine-rich repeat (LRR) protein